MTKETKPLLEKKRNNRKKKEGSTLKTLAHGVSVVNSIPDGLAKMYSSFGPIAITYYPGFWLLAPLGLGITISVSDEAFAWLKNRFPDNKFFKTMAGLAKGANHIVVGFSEDYGFTLSMLSTLVGQFAGINYYNTPLVFLASLIPAALICTTRYRHAEHKERHPYFDIPVNTFRAANASTFGIGILQQEQIIAPNSWIPIAAIVGTGMIGLFSGLLEKYHPKTAKGINKIFIEMTLEQFSLSAALFSIILNIYAATHDDEIKDWIFFTVLGLSLVYFALLPLINLLAFAQKQYRAYSNNKYTYKELVPSYDYDNRSILSINGDLEAQQPSSVIDVDFDSKSDSDYFEPISPSEIITIEDIANSSQGLMPIKLEKPILVQKQYESFSDLIKVVADKEPELFTIDDLEPLDLSYVPSLNIIEDETNAEAEAEAKTPSLVGKNEPEHSFVKNSLQSSITLNKLDSFLFFSSSKNNHHKSQISTDILELDNNQLQP